MSTLILKPEKHTLHVKLNRPEVHNAFNPDAIQELTKVFSDKELEKQYRCVVLRGEGESFCAGGDLNWMKSMVNYTEAENKKDATALFNMFEAIKNCPLPVIALAHGNVFGGGIGLIAACDMVYAEKNTKFCFSEAKIGIIPAVISPFVRKKVKDSYLHEVFLTAEVFGVHRALDMGLIHGFGELRDMYAIIDDKVANILKCGRHAVRETKQLLNQTHISSWEQTKEYSISTIARLRVSPEGQEGLKAFLEKRKPSWQ
jgi:methylglutaconyl-CoA hydratase